MSIIYSYPEQGALNANDMLIGTSTEVVGGKQKNITRNFSIKQISDFIGAGDSVFNPAASDFQIGVFNQGGTKLTGSIMSQNAYPNGSLITITGGLTATGNISTPANLSATGIITLGSNQNLISLNSQTRLNGPILDTTGTIGALNQVLLSDSTGVVRWQNYEAGLTYEGTWDATNNTTNGLANAPALISGQGTSGHFYIVNIGGNVDLDGNNSWSVGDWAIFLDEGSQPASWQKIDNSSEITGSGTANTMSMWTNTTTLNDSLISQNAGATVVSVNGDLKVKDTIQATTGPSTGLKLKGNGTGGVEIMSADGFTDGKIRLNCSDNSHGVTLQSPPHISGATYTLVLPTTSGVTGDVLTSGGVTPSQLTWTTPTTGTVTGTGTTSTLPIWSDGTAGLLGDSIMSYAGTVISVNGDFSTQGLEVNKYLKDGAGSNGADGFVLTSTTSGTDREILWVDPTTIGDIYTFGSSTDPLVSANVRLDLDATTGSDSFVTLIGSGVAITQASDAVTFTVPAGDIYTLGSSTDGSNVKLNLDAASTADSAITLTGAGGLTVAQTNNIVTLTAPAGSDTTYTLAAGAKNVNSVPLNLTPSTGSDTTVNLTEGTGITLTRNAAGDDVTITTTAAIGSFLPIGGGTLTGALSGTSAAFSTTVSATTFTGDLNGTINTLTTAVTQLPAINNTTIATTAFANAAATAAAGVTSVATANADLITIAGTGSGPYTGAVTATAKTAAVSSSSDNLATGTQIQAAIDLALTGALTFKGTFDAATGAIVGSSPTEYLYNCPGGAGTRVAVTIGDLYIASTGGAFYCDTASQYALNVGDEVIATATAAADSSVKAGWSVVPSQSAGGPFLELAGGTMTGNTIHNDSVRSIYGTGSDLQIYHDGSNSYIQDTSGTGDLRIDTSIFKLRSANGGETMIRAFEDGAVILSHNNYDKIGTTSTGIAVTGNGVFTGGLSGTTGVFSSSLSATNATLAGNITFSGTADRELIGSTDQNLIIRANPSTGVSSQGIKLYNRTSLDMSVAEGGGIYFHGYGATPNVRTGTAAYSLAVTSAGNIIQEPISGAGTVTGTGTQNYVTKWSNAGGTAIGNSLIFDNGTSVGIGTSVFPYNPTISTTASSSSPLNTLAVQTTDVLEGTTGTILYTGLGASTGNTYGSIRAFADGGTVNADLALQVGSGSVGIGTTSPDYKLHVEDTSPIIAAQSTGANNTRLLLSAENDAVYIGSTYSTNNMPMYFTQAGTSSGVKRMTIAASGNVGIGTDSPDTLLNINGLAPIMTIEDSSISIGNETIMGRIDFKQNDDSGSGTGVSGSIYSISNSSTGQGSGLAFNTGTPGSTSERMRITSLGGISFGTGGTNYGSNPQVLTSNGDGPPTWEDAGGGLPTKTVVNTTGFNNPTVNLGVVITSTSTAYVDVYVDGVYQNKNTYTLSIGSPNGILTLNSSAIFPTGVSIETVTTT